MSENFVKTIIDNPKEVMLELCTIADAEAKKGNIELINHLITAVQIVENINQEQSNENITETNTQKD